MEEGSEEKGGGISLHFDEVWIWRVQQKHMLWSSLPPAASESVLVSLCDTSGFYLSDKSGRGVCRGSVDMLWVSCLVEPLF